MTLNVNNLCGFGDNGVSDKDLQIISYISRTLTTASTSIAIDRPADVQAGDLLIAFLNVSTASVTTYTSPAGWTEVHDSGQRSISYKIATGSEPTSYTFTCGSSGYMQCGILVIRNANYQNVGAWSNTSTATGITVGNKSLVFCVLSQSNGTSTPTWTVSGWDVAIPKFGATRGDNFSHYLAVFSKWYETGGATGNISTTAARAQLVSCIQN